MLKMTKAQRAAMQQCGLSKTDLEKLNAENVEQWAKTKIAELTSQGMSEDDAIYETDEIQVFVLVRDSKPMVPNEKWEYNRL